MLSGTHSFKRFLYGSQVITLMAMRAAFTTAGTLSDVLSCICKKDEVMSLHVT